VRRLLAVLAAIVVVLLPAAPAWAHNQLIGTAPAADATLAEPPTSVTLTFVQPLNPKFTTIVVSDAARRREPAGAPAIDGGKGTVTLTEPLANGGYTVAYRIVSVDGHVVQGSYDFTVADPALPAAPAAAASAAPASAAASSSGGIPPGVLIGIGVVLVLLAGAAVYLWVSARGRSTATESPRTPSGTPR
jgi:methionine-rich copper-binding protein CopC